MLVEIIMYNNSGQAVNSESYTMSKVSVAFVVGKWEIFTFIGKVAVDFTDTLYGFASRLSKMPWHETIKTIKEISC